MLLYREAPKCEGPPPPNCIRRSAVIFFDSPAILWARGSAVVKLGPREGSGSYGEGIILYLPGTELRLFSP
jgi:hypothetical protein